MRYIVLLLITSALWACDSAAVEDRPVEVSFEEMPLPRDLFLAPPGQYVFRNSTEWDTAEGWWDVVIRCDEGDECHEAPPPHVGFADSLVILVAYGTVACSYAGGSVEHITLAFDTAYVELAPLQELDPKCAAAIHLNHFVRVAKDDVPADTPFAFE